MKQPERLGDAPIEQEYREKMNELARAIDIYFNGAAMKEDRKVGFVLLVSEFSEGGGRANYISNINRADVVTLLKEQIARFEGQPEVRGTA